MNTTNITTAFLALNPVVGVRYSVTAMLAYGKLFEHQDTHGDAIWLSDDGNVWMDEGIVINNTYVGCRSMPVLMA
jgi:hypothetical protein